MAAKQESVSNWQDLAKAYDKADKEIGIIQYVKISLCNKRTRQVLYQYDIPRNMFFRWAWVIDWRAAKLLCKNPKDGITHEYYYYDKKTGLETGIGTLLYKLKGAKATLTLTKNKLQDYIDQSRNVLFFDEATDTIVLKYKAKISQYKEKIYTLEDEIKAKVEYLQNN